MEEFNLTSAKLTGTPGESGWAQVHEFKPEEEEKLKLRGHLFAVISTGSVEDKGEGVESVAAGREVLARLHEEYFGNTEVSAFNALKRSVEKVIGEFSEDLDGVEIAAITVVDGVVYSAAGSGAEISIFRKGMLAPILKSKENEVVSASGHPQFGDAIILATSSFTKDAKEGVLKAALESGGAEEAVESFAPMVHSKEESGRDGVCVVEFSRNEELSAIEVAGEEPKEETLERQALEKEEKTQEKESFDRTRAPSFLSKLGGFVKEKIPGRKLYVGRSEVDVEDAQKKKLAITTGVILVVLLLVSIVFGVRQKRINEERERYQTRLEQARHELDEAKNLFSLNPERARELFASSSQIINQLEKEGVEDPALAELKSELEQSRQSVLGEHDVSAEELIDLELLNKTTVDALVASVDRVFVLDKDKDRVVQIVIETKRTETIAGPSQINDAQGIASYTDRVFIVENDGVFEVGSSREEAIEKEWDGEILLQAYAANLYVLSKEESQVWRYAGVDEGFASQSDWLAPGVEPDFPNVISWAIDGSIWILTSTGNVEKYTLGNPQPIEDIKASPAMLSPTHIYTNEELDNVYILDPETARVVVFDKEGKYKAQYRNEVFRTSNGLYANEELGRIVVSSQNKLYAVPLAEGSE